MAADRDGASAARPGEPAPTSGDEVRDAVAAHVAAFNDLDAGAVAAGFAPDAVFTHPDHEAVGQRELYALFRETFAGMASAELSVRRMVVAGDTAACEMVQRVRWPEGGSLEVAFAAFYTIADGLIARVRVYRDLPD